MNSVYLIDDAGDPSMSKFADLQVFIDSLNNNFLGQQFCWGAMRYKAATVPHSEVLSGDASEIVRILEEPDSVVLVDVAMEPKPCVTAARELIERFPNIKPRALEIGCILTDSAKPIEVIPDMYLLCATVIALGEAKCTRIGVVSTETRAPASQALGHLGPPQIRWNRTVWRQGQTDELMNLVNQSIQKKLDPVRTVWAQMLKATNQPLWLDEVGNCGSLFPSGKSHHLSYYLDNPRVLHRCEQSLLTATNPCAGILCSFNTLQERVAVLKAATRDCQLPVFVLQRILGQPETQDVAEAISWNRPAWDAPAVCIGVAALKGNDPPVDLEFQLHRDIRQASVRISVHANEESLDSVEEALRLGAARRARLPGREGAPGNLTFGVEMLSPTTRQRLAGRLEIRRKFDLVKL